MRNQPVHDVENVNHVLDNMEINVATKHVTTNQIIEEFKGVKDAFEWRVTPEQRIRGILKGNPEGRVFDPITAVAFVRTGRFFSEGHSCAAARGVGLSFGDSADLVAACNYGFPCGAGPGDLRHDLMAAVLAGSSGISEHTAITH